MTSKYEVKPTSKFRKDRKRMIKRGYDVSLLEDVVQQLAAGKQLDEKYCDHQLHGKMKDFRECHITPDWLLIYRVDNNVLVLWLMETGSHSDLF